MIRQFTCSDIDQLQGLLERQEEQQASVDGIVAEILARVRAQGDAALLDYTEQFDGVRLDALQVSGEEIQEAVACTDKEFLGILREAAGNIRSYHEKQKHTGFVMTEKPGVVLGQRVLPLDRVGVYVPGGTASYPSTVLMDVIPAHIAGVGEIVMVSPPGKDGKIPDDILAAASIAGVDKIFKLGGAQAVAALAYGTGSVPRVDKIVGPGNIFVATAKRMVYGLVDIEMIAGPSDILVIADDSADPACVAADLLSQAEHDVLASSVLVTTSKRVAGETVKQLYKQLETLPRREMTAASIESNGAVILAQSLEQAAEISNRIAPEHLEICTQEPFALLPLVKHAGSVFLGHYAPEALGDYFAGPNHTLPTGGTARFASPLGVDDFVKRTSYLYCQREALEKDYKKIETFAKREGLDAHARSVAIRFVGVGQ